MMPRLRNSLLALALVMLSLNGLIAPAHAEPRREPTAAQGQSSGKKAASLTPAEAAAEARARYGGKVIKVQRKGNGFRVRLLQDSGRVITVTIKG